MKTSYCVFVRVNVNNLNNAEHVNWLRHNSGFVRTAIFKAQFLLGLHAFMKQLI